MQLLGSTKSKLTKDENDKDVSHLEITGVVLIHCNIVNNDYSRNLYAFVANKSFGQLLVIYHKNFMFSKALNLEFPYIIVWFTDQSS